MNNKRSTTFGSKFSLQSIHLPLALNTVVDKRQKLATHEKMIPLDLKNDKTNKLPI
jgi:hypothetical protein